MAVTMVKPKIKEASELDSLSLVSAEVVDEFAVLSNKLATKQKNIAPLAKSVAAMEKDILGTVDEVLAPNQPINLAGNVHEVQLGPKGQRTVITNMELAIDMLGEELFLKLAKITMKDLQAYLTPDQLEKVTASNYTAKRRVKVEKLA